MVNIMLKAKYSLISALVFFIVANPEFYRFTRMVYDGPDATMLIIHTVLFFFAMLGLMMVPVL
jgi:hypothetical protein